ncbi:hypothetical protein COK76_24510, partial [Bacillus cereus]
MSFYHCIKDMTHAQQAKKSKYPKTRKFTSPDENIQFFWGSYKILKLMDMFIQRWIFPCSFSL